MEWLRKINKKKYLLGTLINLIWIWFLLMGNFTATLLLSILVLCTIMNQVLLIGIVYRAYKNILALPDPNEGSVLAKTISFLVAAILKLVVIIVPFWMITDFDRNLVLHGLILYTFQLIIFVLSIKKDTTFLYNKG